MNSDKIFESHSISVNDRRHSELTGIDDVLSFDDNSITMHSAMGDMVIEGEELKIESFSADRGILTVMGKVNGLYYLEDEDKKRSSSKKRLFK